MAAERGDGGAKEAGHRPAALLGVLLFVLLAAVLLSLCEGAVRIPLRVVFDLLAGGKALPETERAILLELRLPRILAAAIVGAALSVAGLLFQGLFRNPLADPYVVGSSGGAVLGAAISIFFFTEGTLLGFSMTAVFAFAGSLAAMMLVYLLARTRGGTELVSLLLAGFAVSTVFSNATYLFELQGRGADLRERMLMLWLRGAIGIPARSQLGLAGMLLLLGGAAAWPLMRHLNTLALGEEYARQLGLRVESARMLLLVVGALLTAVAVSLGGLISFAGLIVPHTARLLLGPDHTRLLPVTALGGAILVVLADTLARSVFRPLEVPVGVLLALAGGPFFLLLLRRSTRSHAL